MRRLVVAIFLFVPGILVGASPYAGFERILLPVAVQNPSSPLPGANGSLWATVLSVTNLSPTLVEVHGALVECRTVCGATIFVHGGATAVAPFIQKVNVNPAAFLLVEPERASDVAVQLRVQDISRQSQTRGTSVPVVREADLFLDRIELLDIPSSRDFRSLIRIYDFDESLLPRRVRVRIFSYDGRGVLDADLPVFDEQFDFIRIADDFAWPQPGFIQLPLPEFENLGANVHLRVEITPVSEGLRFWAFASVVHNVTQHLTAITPAR